MNTQLSFLLFLLIIINGKIQSQCGVNVNAGNDITICGFDNVNLSGTASGGNITGTCWVSPFGFTLNEGNNLSTFVTETTTFTFVAKVFDGSNNLLINGGFEGGIGGAFSSYIPGTGGSFGLLSNEGTYAIATDASTTHTNFSPCTGQGGGGSMMVVNGATTPNENVWCQVVNTEPNTDYVFSAWIASVIGSNPAILQFSINGTLLGAPFNVPGSPCSWAQFSEEYTSLATSALICIVNQNTVAGGNDFALDNIFFGPVCEQEDEVTVHVVDVQALATPAELLPCNASQGVLLDGSASTSGPNISYEWTTTDGNIVSGTNANIATVNQSGTYNFTVTYNDGTTNCSVSTISQVIDNPDVPFINIADPDTLDCTNPTTMINTIGTVTGAPFSYQWTTTDGNIVSGATGLAPIVDMPGAYELQVINNDNGCENTAIIEVPGDNTMPIAVANNNGNSDCLNPTLSIDGIGSSVGANFQYNWTTTDGNIVTGANTLAPIIDAAGTYQLLVTNTNNGCTEVASTITTSNAALPMVAVNSSQNIDCNHATVDISGTGSSSGTIYQYEWSTTNGNIVSGQNSLNISVDQTGDYSLTVTNTVNGCTASTGTTVIDDLVAPALVIAQPEMLTCINDVLDINANSSTNTGNVSYNWTTSNGNILTGQNTLMPTINSIGTYQLMITNNDNGCSSMEAVVVTEDVALPTAEAGSADAIDCSANSVQLSGTNSSQGSQFTYAWSTNNGNILTGQTALTPEVDEVGWYYLLVTNEDNGCTAIDSVEIEQNGDLPMININVGDTLSCDNLTLELDGTNSSSGPNFSIQWTTNDGNITANANTLNPTVDAPGMYELTIIDNTNNCTANMSVEVEGSTDLPLVEAGQPFTLNCEFPTTNLDTDGSSVGANFTYNWTTTDGNIISNPNQVNPEVNANGTYVLVITNTDNGCSETDEVVIDADFNNPIADAGLPQTLTCTELTQTLGSTNTSLGANFVYQWSTTNGNIVSGINSPEPVVSAEGTYQILVTNTQNGCTAISDVLITQDADFPFVNIEAALPITCASPTIELLANAQTGIDISYQWTTQNGDIIAGADGLNPEVGSAGIYELTVINAVNNCENATTVEVLDDLVSPIVDAGQTVELSCTVDEIQLDGSNTQVGSEFEYQWTTQNGNIVSDANTLSPTIDAAGTYNLLITNLDNGCSDSDEVIITQDATIPTADAGSPDTLSCTNTVLSLTAANSSQGNEFSYQWTTTNGNIVSDANTLSPTIDAPGIYFLTVLNMDNNCESLASVQIEENVTNPTITIANPQELTCDTTLIALDAANSSQGAEFQYQWTTNNGNIVSGSMGEQPEIDAAGVYQLTITNMQNGCESMSTVEVFENVTVPQNIIQTPNEITCTEPNILLDATDSSIGAEFTYEWTTTDGNILNGANTLTPEITESGLYSLLIRNSLNGCEVMESIEVTENTTVPLVSIQAPNILDCANQFVDLYADSSSQGMEFQYQWTTTEGSITMGGNSLNPTINAPGEYQLLVTNTINGCTNSEDVIVLQDILPPIIAIASPDAINCIREEVNLAAVVTNTGNDIVYQWTSNTGNIVNGFDTANPTVNTGGIYNLTVFNADNGCTETQTVVVEEDTQTPIVDAGEDAELDCFTNELTLAATIQGAGVYQYSWQTTSGNIINNQNTATPNVDSPGVYVLVITDVTNGCTAEDALTVSQNIPIDFQFVVIDPTCANNVGRIDVETVVGGTTPYLYSIDNGNSFQSSSSFTNLETGNYDLVIQDANGCELAESAFIDAVETLPLFLEAEAQLTFGEVYQIQVQTPIPEADFTEIIWTPIDGLSCADCLEPQAQPLQNKTYHLQVREGNGCVAETSIFFRVRRDLDVYFPNSFSPNGDGSNDTFFPFARENTIEKINSFKVFDRWGDAVFTNADLQPNDAKQGWDGTHRGEVLNPAVFVYMAEVLFIDGTVELFKGDVTLMR